MNESNLDIKYIHHRPYIDYFNKGDNNPPVRLYFNQATIAYTKPAGGKCVVAFARCNNKDNYNKHIGRTIASNRLGREGIVVDVEPGKHIETILNVVKGIINNLLICHEN
jgi:hypothetical protein